MDGDGERVRVRVRHEVGRCMVGEVWFVSIRERVRSKGGGGGEAGAVVIKRHAAVVWGTVSVRPK
jgi:hypothetical protein